MAIVENNTTTRNNDNKNTFWLNIEGNKKETSVAFNPTRAFAGINAEQVLKVVTTQEPMVSCHNKVSVKLIGTKPDGNRFIFGYLNNYSHGINVHCTREDIAEVVLRLKDELGCLTLDDISKPMSTDEAADILAAL